MIKSHRRKVEAWKKWKTFLIAQRRVPINQQMERGEKVQPITSKEVLEWNNLIQDNSMRIVEIWKAFSTSFTLHFLIVHNEVFFGWKGKLNTVKIVIFLLLPDFFKFIFYTLLPLSNIDFTVIINHFNFFTEHLAYHHLKSENAPRDLTFFLTHL